MLASVFRPPESHPAALSLKIRHFEVPAPDEVHVFGVFSVWRAPPNKSTQELFCLLLYRLSYMIPRDHGRIRTGDHQFPITLPLRLGFAHRRA